MLLYVTNILEDDTLCFYYGISNYSVIHFTCGLFFLCTDNHLLTCLILIVPVFTVYCTG